MEQAATMSLGLGLQVSDVSGQKVVKASSVPLSSTIGELVDGLLARMGLARIDAEGRPLHWYARLEREGRHLNGSETVGEALLEGDELTLTPNIDAGGR
jgi:hypothetical protein